jgi:hypothetical protein
LGAELFVLTVGVGIQGSVRSRPCFFLIIHSLYTGTASLFASHDYFSLPISSQSTSTNDLLSTLLLREKVAQKSEGIAPHNRNLFVHLYTKAVSLP